MLKEFSEAEFMVLSSIPTGSATLSEIRELTSRLAREEADGVSEDVPWERVVEVVINMLEAPSQSDNMDREMADLNDKSRLPAPTVAAVMGGGEQAESQRRALSALVPRKGQPWRDVSPIPSTDGSTLDDKEDTSGGGSEIPSLLGSPPPFPPGPSTATTLLTSSISPTPLPKPVTGRKKRSPSNDSTGSVQRSASANKSPLVKSQPTRASPRFRSSLIPASAGVREAEGSSPLAFLSGATVPVGSFALGSCLGSEVPAPRSSSSSGTSNLTATTEKAGEERGAEERKQTDGVGSRPSAFTVERLGPLPEPTTSLSIVHFPLPYHPMQARDSTAAPPGRHLRSRSKRSLPGSLPIMSPAPLSPSSLSTSNLVAKTGKEKRLERKKKVAERTDVRRTAAVSAGEGGKKKTKKGQDGKVVGERMMTRSSRRSEGGEGEGMVGGLKELFI